MLSEGWDARRNDPGEANPGQRPEAAPARTDARRNRNRLLAAGTSRRTTASSNRERVRQTRSAASSVLKESTNDSAMALS